MCHKTTSSNLECQKCISPAQTPSCLRSLQLLLLLFSSQVVSNSLQPYGLWPTRLLCPWDSSGKNTGVGCHFLLQDVFPTQGLNLPLLHYQVDSLPLSHLERPPATISGANHYKKNQAVLASAAHILKLERYRED